jgi:hypothetical protein
MSTAARRFRLTEKQLRAINDLAAVRLTRTYEGPVGEITQERKQLWNTINAKLSHLL